MTDRYLEVTYRNGKLLAAYLYLPRQANEKSVRTQEAGHGMVVDFGSAGHAIGIELTAPTQVTLERLNAILKRLNVPPVEEKDLAPLAAA
jgi:uncharacterized protein YuzE